MNKAGAETMLMNLYRNLDKSQFQFDFVVFKNIKGDFDEEIKSLGGKIIYIPGNNFFDRTKSLKKFILDNKYKVIHSHTLLSTAFHIYAAYRANIPFRIVHAHSTYDKSAKTLKGKVYQSFAKFLIRKFSTNLIACSYAASDFLYGNNPPSKPKILYNSIDLDVFESALSSNDDYLNEKFGISNSVFKIVQVGRLENVKNPYFSIQLAKELLDRGIDFKMIFVGQGSLLEDVKQQTVNMGLSDYITFAGLRSDIPEIMSDADLMIMPSLYEGFPVVLVESQAMGLPALISKNISAEVDLGLGLIDFLKLDKNLWLERIIYHINHKFNTNKKQNKSERLRVLREKGFDVKNSCRDLESLYSELIKR